MSDEFNLKGRARIQERAWQLSYEVGEEWAVQGCDIEKTYIAIFSYFNSFIYLVIYFKLIGLF